MITLILIVLILALFGGGYYYGPRGGGSPAFGGYPILYVIAIVAILYLVFGHRVVGL